MNLYHLSAVISFLRHGEKDDGGNLTSGGQDQAKYRALKLRSTQGQVHVNHSGVGRVRDTAHIVSRYIHSEVDQEIVAGVNHPERELTELHYVYDKSKPSTYFSSWGPDTNEIANKRVQDFLDLRDVSPEPETTPSPKQMAQRLGRVLLNQLGISLSTSYETTENFINTSHEPVLMSFLFYCLQDFHPTATNFVESIGGSISYAEGFDVNVYQKETGETLIYLDFREYFYWLDMQLLNNFVEN